MANVQQDKELMKLLKGAVGAGAKSAFPWSSLVSGLFSLGSSALGYAQNQQNIKAQREANQQNLALTREANSAQMRESEKAYQRSLPTNQVANFRAAGMSHAGALQALSGGGSYSPAPVNTGQVEPVQGSSAGVQQGIESMLQAIMHQQSNATQMKIAREQMEHDIKITEMQLADNRDQRDHEQVENHLNRKNQKEISAHTSSENRAGVEYTANKHLEGILAGVNMDKSRLDEIIRQFNVMSPYYKNHYVAQVKHLESVKGLNDQQKQEIADKLADWNSTEQKDARAAMAVAQAMTGQYNEEILRFELAKFAKSFCKVDDDGNYIRDKNGNLVYKNRALVDEAFKQNRAGRYTDIMLKMTGADQFIKLLGAIL